MKQLISTVLCLLVIVGCASTPKENQKVDYGAFVKSAELQSTTMINSFRFSGWQSLDDRYLIIRVTNKRRYLIELQSRCLDLKFAHGIKVNNMSNIVLSTRADSISVLSSPRQKCYIKSIYSMDEQQLKDIKEL